MKNNKIEEQMNKELNTLGGQVESNVDLWS